MVEIFSNSYVISSLVFVVLQIIVGVVVFVKTGSIYKSISKMLEVNKLKYKTIDDVQQRKPVGQTFSEYVDDYILNSETNELEKLKNPRNLQAEIQSHIDCALERAFEKFLPKVESVDDSIVADYTQRTEDLAVLGQAIDTAEYYRDKYELGDDVSVADIYKYVDTQAKALKDSINKRVKPDVKPDVNGGAPNV